MAKLMKVGKRIQEGEVINRWIENRLIRQNKNVLVATTGPTGSAKSYQDLRKAELWYNHHFKKPFPPENICFSVAEVMRRITSGELKKGDLLIFEEAGVNMGALDFQARVSKLFAYILQSFRSLNVGILFNLPYLSMLNKSARLLIHVHFITSGINYQKKTSKSKAYFRQVNQRTGKIYHKFLRVRNPNGKIRTIKKFVYKLPSERLINAYEHKKDKFVINISKEFVVELDEKEKDKLRKMDRKEISEIGKRTLELVERHGIKKTAKIEKISVRSVYDRLKTWKKHGYEAVIAPNPLEKPENEDSNPIPKVV